MINISNPGLSCLTEPDNPRNHCRPLLEVLVDGVAHGLDEGAVIDVAGSGNEEKEETGNAGKHSETDSKKMEMNDLVF